MLRDTGHIYSVDKAKQSNLEEEEDFEVLELEGDAPAGGLIKETEVSKIEGERSDFGENDNSEEDEYFEENSLDDHIDKGSKRKRQSKAREKHLLALQKLKNYTESELSDAGDSCHRFEEVELL
jgi:hypothetical protein